MVESESPDEFGNLIGDEINIEAVMQNLLHSDGPMSAEGIDAVASATWSV
jgi:hypothetical protein